MVVTRVTPEEYLAEENAREERAEYFDGEVVMMAGAPPQHERVVTGVANVVLAHLAEGPCEPFIGNTRVRAGATYAYPDLVVACDARFEDAPSHCLLNPLVIVEVLSPSTEGIDRSAKLVAYRTIESLREYLLVSTDAPRIEIFRRVEEGWVNVVVEGEDATLRLTSVGLDLPFAHVFARRIADGWAE